MFIYSSGRGYRGARFTGGGGFGCLIFGIIGMVAAYFILKGLFKLLYWAAPVLFVLALVINWRAVVDTFKDWLKGMETNPIGGLFTAALAVLLFPVFALYLFVKALGHNKMQQMKREFGADQSSSSEEFVEFEELESTPKGGPPPDAPMEPLVLPEKEPEHANSKKRRSKDKQPDAEEGQSKKKPEKPDNPYDQLFE